MKNVIGNIKVSKSENNNTCVISLEGELTLNNAAAIKNELAAAFKKSDSLHITVQNVTSIDLSWFQLMQSFKNTCKHAGKDIGIAMTLNADAELLLARAGFGSILESSKPNNQTIR